MSISPLQARNKTFHGRMKFTHVGKTCRRLKMMPDHLINENMMFFKADIPLLIDSMPRVQRQGLAQSLPRSPRPRGQSSKRRL